MFNLNAQMKYTFSHIPAKVKIVKTMTGPDWEAALLTYRALIEPVIVYGFALFMPVVSKTWMLKLQAVHNTALRMVTGCHDAASEAHFHQKCKMLPVKEHLDLH